ncbi:hypothetical protein C8J57DRAFT_1271082 [Mycena rebaudengoi]|nr:hypothetical protein C8J57DRAFT_1271082 [Mycena rebaudengoi]
MKQLGEHIQDITKIHSIAVQELDHNPRFTTELGLRMRQIEFSESVLQSKILSAKDIKWKVYPQNLKCLWCSIEECEWQVREIRTSMLLEIEANHQRKYTRDILQRRATFETIFPAESSLYGTDGYALEAAQLWNGRYGSAPSSPNIGRS